LKTADFCSACKCPRKMLGQQICQFGFETSLLAVSILGRSILFTHGMFKTKQSRGYSCANLGACILHFADFCKVCVVINRGFPKLPASISAEMMIMNLTRSIFGKHSKSLYIKSDKYKDPKNQDPEEDL
jgi:hypothetical protein